MPIITLLTDFGTEDEYVGVMKGTILSIHPQAVIVDLTHHVSPQQVLQAAHILEASYRYFPEGTIHVIVVDPGVGTDRRIIVLKNEKHVFLAPDNGVLSLILDAGSVEFAAVVEADDFFLKPVSRTFHGRDIFAPLAAHLSKGLPLSRLGSETSPDQLNRLEIAKPYVAEDREIIGSIVGVDHFGNLITDIDGDTIRNFLENDPITVCASGSWDDPYSDIAMPMTPRILVSP